MNQTLSWTNFGSASGAFAPQASDLSTDFLKQALPPREFKVLALRFGLEGNPPHKIRQIAEMLGVSKERVRQLEYKALRLLRSP